MRIDLAGDQTPRVVVSGESRPRALATDGDRLLFETASFLRVTSFDTPRIASSVISATDPLVVADLSNIYWAADGEVRSMAANAFAGR